MCVRLVYLQSRPQKPHLLSCPNLAVTQMHALLPPVDHFCPLGIWILLSQILALPSVRNFVGWLMGTRMFSWVPMER